MADHLPEIPAKNLVPSVGFPVYKHEKIQVIFSEVFPWGVQIPSPAYAASRLRPLALLLLITA